MRINVTEEHIAKGKPQELCGCPIALAIEEQTGIVPMVWGLMILVGDQEQYVAARVGRFIDRFDDGLPVKPFSFNLRVNA